MRKKGSAPPAVLVVDDEQAILDGASVTLRTAGMKRVLVCRDSRDVPDLLRDEDVAVVLLDLNMPHLPGIELLTLIHQEFPAVTVVVMTGTDDLETAVVCMREGAFDYLVKPVEGSRLAAVVRRALEIASLRGEVSTLKRRLLSGGLENAEAFSAIRTRNEKLLALFRYVEAVAPSPHPILVCGETGSGKELVARAVHSLSGRDGEFVAVNVAGLDDTLFSDTLFGHHRGAFTGAEAGRDGLISKASGGTLFLDEIGDLTPPSQVRLLRLIQEKVYYPLGSDAARKTDARVLVSTHQDLQGFIDEGRFRKDLFYRLGTHQVVIPPLRERMEDLPLLVEQFLEEAARFLGKKVPTAPAELLTLLETYQFPGNVRELQNMVFDAVAQHHSGILPMKSFRDAIEGGPRRKPEARPAEGGRHPLSEAFPGAFPTLKEAEKALIDEALRRAKGNQGVAARLLGISRQALNKRLLRSESRQ